jgi:hypothetical protein
VDGVEIKIIKIININMKNLNINNFWEEGFYNGFLVHESSECYKNGFIEERDT